LLGDEPAAVTFAFDPGGSLAEVYNQQGSDLGFAAGMMGWTITDERFPQALDLAAEEGLEIRFVTEPLAGADHPNTVEIRMISRQGQQLCLAAKSIGGGAVVFTRVDGWPVHFTGDSHQMLVELKESAEPAVHQLLTHNGQIIGQPARRAQGGLVLLHAQRQSPLGTDAAI